MPSDPARSDSPGLRAKQTLDSGDVPALVIEVPAEAIPDLLRIGPGQGRNDGAWLDGDGLGDYG